MLLSWARTYFTLSLGISLASADASSNVSAERYLEMLNWITMEKEEEPSPYDQMRRSEAMEDRNGINFLVDLGPQEESNRTGLFLRLFWPFLSLKAGISGADSAMDSLLKSALVANGGGVRAAFTPLADDVSQVQSSSSPPCSSFRFHGEIHVALALGDPDLSALAQCLPESLGDEVGGHWMFRDDEESIRCNLCKPINEQEKKRAQVYIAS